MDTPNDISDLYPATSGLYPFGYSVCTKSEVSMEVLGKLNVRLDRICFFRIFTEHKLLMTASCDHPAVFLYFKLHRVSVSSFSFSLFKTLLYVTEVPHGSLSFSLCFNY